MLPLRWYLLDGALHCSTPNYLSRTLCNQATKSMLVKDAVEVFCDGFSFSVVPRWGIHESAIGAPRLLVSEEAKFCTSCIGRVFGVTL